MNNLLVNVFKPQGYQDFLNFQWSSNETFFNVISN